MEQTDPESLDGGIPQTLDEALAERLRLCQEQLGYRFHNPKLLHAALIHASGADHRLQSNERLEFLGDAVLGFVVCEWLYHQYPNRLEGELTRIKSIAVSRQVCTRLSKELGLGDYLLLGKGLTSTGSIPSSVLSDVFEAIVAAVYLDGGLESARQFICRVLEGTIEKLASQQVGSNYKSLLQQLAQRYFSSTPIYLVEDEKGPDHNKQFFILAQVGRRRFDPQWGSTKKEAEQRAAAVAYAILDEEVTAKKEAGREPLVDELDTELTEEESPIDLGD